jgi:hypothetical protein
MTVTEVMETLVLSDYKKCPDPTASQMETLVS